MDNNIYHMISGIKKVSGFLGSKGIPVPTEGNRKDTRSNKRWCGTIEINVIDYWEAEKVRCRWSFCILFWHD